MFTYKFVGLDKLDAETPYYYGSLPAKPELGHILAFHESGNHYAVVGINGEGLVGNGPANQKELASPTLPGANPCPRFCFRSSRKRSNSKAGLLRLTK
ncbi:MAG: hypothetical protein ACRD4R_02000 [Candidatus Acidiferrales bacterium]